MISFLNLSLTFSRKRMVVDNIGMRFGGVMCEGEFKDFSGHKLCCGNEIYFVLEDQLVHDLTAGVMLWLM